MADVEELFELVEEEKLSNDGESFTFSRLRGSGSTLDILRKFRADGEAGFCDVVLEVEGKQFPAHRNVLAANSRFFYVMFTSSMKESRAKHLKLESISLSAFETILNFFYSNDIVINRDNVEELLEASDFLMLGGVKKACIKVLSRILDVENCFKIKTLAERFSADDLVNKVCRFIGRNFSVIVEEQEEFLELEPNELVELISSDELLVESEEESYFAALKWIKHDSQKRVETFTDVLRALKFGSLSKEFLQSQLENEPLLKQNKECMVALEHVLIEEQDGYLRTIKRSSTHEMVDVIFGSTKHIYEDCANSFCYDVSGKQAFLLPNIPKSVVDFRVAIVNETVYKVGGTKEILDLSSRLSACSFDLEKRSRSGEMQWEKKASFQLPRTDFVTAVLNDCIYVIGGTRDDIVAKKSVEKYIPDKNEWQFVAALSERRMNLCAAADENYIFAIGGAATASAEKYDPLSNIWVQIAPMTHNFGDNVNKLPFACHVDGKIYALEHEVRGEIYNISTDEWYRISPLPRVHNNVDSSFLANKGDVYVFVSSNNIKVFKYVPIKDKWEDAGDCFPGLFRSFDDFEFQYHSFQMRKLCLKGLEEADVDFFYDNCAKHHVSDDDSADSDSHSIQVDEERDSDENEDLDEDDDEFEDGGSDDDEDEEEEEEEDSDD